MLEAADKCKFVPTMHHAIMMKIRRVKRSAFGLAWYNKAVFYIYTEKPSFNETPDRVQVRVRKSELPF